MIELSRGRSAWLWIALVGCLSTLPFLGQVREVISNEVRHAEIARETFAHGNWLVPTLLGEVYRDKPPIFHTCAALVYHAAGHASLGLARFVSAGSGILAVLVWFALAQRLTTRKVAFFSCLALWGLPGFSWEARIARPDMLFVLATLSACLALARAWTVEGKRQHFWNVAGGLALGFALVCKGPVSLLVVALFATLVPATHEHIRSPGWRMWLGLLAGIVLSVGGWASAVAIADADYLRAVLFQPDLPWNEDKSVVAARYWFYPVQTVTHGIPLVLCLPWAVREYLREKRGRGALLVFLVGMLALSLFNKKRAHYLLPLYPFLALFAVENLVDWRALRAKRILALTLALSVIATPLRYQWVNTTPGAKTPAKFEMAANFMSRVDPDATVLARGKVAYELALLSGRSDIGFIRDQAGAVAARLLEAREPGYIVATEEDFASLDGKRLEVELVATDEHYQPERGWSLARFRPRLE